MDRYKISREDFIQLLQQLLQQGIVDSILSGKEKGNHYTIEPNFINDSEQLSDFPLSQLLVYSFARTDSPANSMLHSQKGLTEKVAVIGHACDVRALVELHKKNQVKWDNLFLIAFEDMGYIEVTPMMKFLKNEGIDAAQIVGERLTQTQFILKLDDGSTKNVDLGSGLNISENCSRCIQKKHVMADILVSTYALSEDDDNYILTPQSDRAKKLVQELNWSSKKVAESFNSEYDKIANEIITSCTEKREQELNAFESSPDRMTRFGKCTGCGLCVKSCPVCFCPECSLVAAVKAKTIDKLTFVITRFAHVGDTCVECGKCNSNCPSQVPLALGFQSLRRKFKNTYNYEAGSDLEAKIFHLNM